jgi:hypothetical protein
MPGDTFVKYDETYYGIKLTGAAPSAYVTKLNGNTNNLTVTVAETYNNGTNNVLTRTFSIANNSAGVFDVGAYKIYVDTKGNVQIRACYIVG